MKPEELAMLCIAYKGDVDAKLGVIKFPKTIPDGILSMLTDYTTLKEENDCYSCGVYLYDSNNKVIADEETLSKIIGIMCYQKDYLLMMRYLIPETSIEYLDDMEVLEFVHLFTENAYGENERMTENIYHGAEPALYKVFAILTFITEWASSKYTTDDESTIFECDERILPCNFNGYDIRSIGIDFVEVLPFPIAGFSKIEYIRIPFTNVFTAIENWYNDSKEFRTEYMDFLRSEEYLSNDTSGNENTGLLISNAVRAYLVKGGYLSETRRDEDTFLAQIFSIFSDGKYKLFIKETQLGLNGPSYKYIPTTVTHSIQSSNGCFSEFRLLINRSSHWYIDINGNIVTRDTSLVDTEEMIVTADGVNAVSSAIEFQKVKLNKLPISMIQLVLHTQLSMRTVAKENSRISYMDAKPITEIDLVMYYANYYVQNGLDHQNDFFTWWGNISHNVKFADGEICRNLDVLADFFSDERKIIIKSEDDSINDKIWNIGMYGIYIFTLKCEMETPNTLLQSQINRLRWIRYSIFTKIREIHTFPWAKQKTLQNPLMKIAEDPDNCNGLDFILAAASLNIDTYTIYPVYQYLVRTVTKDMLMCGFNQLETLKKGDFKEVFRLLTDFLSCNVVPISVYRLAILTIRNILSHRRKDIEKDAKTYLSCLRILDNKFVSYRERTSLTKEYYSNDVIGQEVGLKIINYAEMNDLAKQVEKSVAFLDKDRIFENWNNIMRTKEIMNRDNIGVFNESMINFLTMLE